MSAVGRQPVASSSVVGVVIQAGTCRLLAPFSALPRQLFAKVFATAVVSLASSLSLTCGFGQQSFPVTVVSLSGDEQSRQLNEIADGKALFTDGTAALNELLLIDTGRAAGNLATGGKFLVLFDNGRIPFDSIAYADEVFRVQAAWGSASLAPDCVAGLVLKGDADLTRFEMSLKGRSVETDTVIAEGNEGQQVVSGLIESLDGSRVQLNYQGESRTISLSRLVGIVTANISSQLPDGVRATVTLVDGGSFTGVPEQLRNGVLSLTLPGGSRANIGFSSVSSVSFTSDSFAWLSQLEMESSSFVPLTWLPFEARRDLNVLGEKMTLRWPSTGKTRTFARGIGLRPTSRIEYRNDEGYKRLVAVVGIDSGTDGAGNCEVSVSGDGVRLWSAQITGKTDPVELNLSIDGVSRLEITVRPGELLDTGDHVNWADARLVK
jgi:NPCBM/NEW2 domain